MKTALSIPDRLHAEAERLARRLGRSRSRLYTDALREYLARHDPDAVTEALNRVYDEDAATEVDRAVTAAGERVLLNTEW